MRMLLLVSAGVILQIACASAEQSKEVVRFAKGTTSFVVERSRGPLRVDIRDSTVRCNRELKKQKVTVTNDFKIKMTESAQRQISAALGLGVDVKGIKAEAGIRDAITREVEKGVTSAILSETTMEVEVRPDRCFHNSAFLLYERDQYIVKVKTPGLFGPTEDVIEWPEHTGVELWITSVHDEECGRVCRIEEKGRAVEIGRPGGEAISDVRVRIVHGNREFSLPLYWDEQHRIINPFRLLPRGIQDELRRAGLVPRFWRTVEQSDHASGHDLFFLAPTR